MANNNGAQIPAREQTAGRMAPLTRRTVWGPAVCRYLQPCQQKRPQRPGEYYGLAAAAGNPAEPRLSGFGENEATLADLHPIR